MAQTSQHPRIVGIGGTTKINSTTEKALKLALSIAEKNGAQTQLFDGPFLADLPIYRPELSERTDAERLFVDTVRSADALILATPGYHGGIAGFLKNAIDLLEDTAKDQRVYFSGMPIGLLVTAFGWQATGSTLASLRSIVHAMRGWPTPLGVAINTRETPFDADGGCEDGRVVEQLGMMVDNILWFTGRQQLT